MRVQERRSQGTERFVVNSIDTLPIVVIGGGPVGLAAAAHLVTRGLPFLVLEATDSVAACFRSTAHVRLFSPWKMNIDGAAARVLEARGWNAPEPNVMPTAGEMRSNYLEPLAVALAPHVRYNTRVQRISRRGFDKVKTAGREHAPFVLQVHKSGITEGTEEVEARAVIDATGNWATPSYMGAHGLPAIGESEHVRRISYGMPDVLGSERSRYERQRVLVVGSGHSAMGSLLALAELATQDQQTRIAWAIRGDNLERIFGGGAKDGLPERGSLGTRLRDSMQAGALEVYRGFRISAVSAVATQLRVSGLGRDGTTQHISSIDEIIVATGSRPDLSLGSELRLALDPWLESTPQLAPLIDPNVHSCGSVPPHGHRELEHPEKGFYAIGSKSYGRAPNFLLATGYEQARSVVAALAGDLAAADEVQLKLPETGVCVTDFAASETGGGCCAPAAEATTDEAPNAGGCCPAPVRQPFKSRCCG
jgi:thioredoxin reductase